MGMPAPQPVRRWTAQMVRETFDLARHSPRYEVIDGELLVSFAESEPAVTNAPSVAHQRAVRGLFRALDEYVRAGRLGEAFTPPADLELEPGTILQPDVFVVPLVGRQPARAWSEMKELLLAVEVLSPSTARYDRVTKRRFFARARVPEYWIVDLDARVVERWRPDDERAEVLDERLAWHPEGAPDALDLDLPSLFREAHAEA
ncbi:MAG: Uma2 family endonuclease [Gemmatimonadaceae bacterium]